MSVNRPSQQTQQEGAYKYEPKAPSKPRLETSKVSELGSSSLFKGLEFSSAQKPRQTSTVSNKQAEVSYTTAESKKQEKVHFERTKGGRRLESRFNGTPKESKIEETDQSGTNEKGKTNKGSRVSFNDSKMTEQFQISRSPKVTTKKDHTINEVQSNKQKQRSEASKASTNPYIYRSKIGKPNVEKVTENAVQSTIISSSKENADESRVQKIERHQPQPRRNSYNRQNSHRSSDMNLDLEINVNTKMFKLEVKGQSSRRSSQEKSSRSVNQVPKRPIPQNQSQNEVSKPSESKSSSYVYKKPKTKEQLAMEAQKNKEVSDVKSRSNRYSTENYSQNNKAVDESKVQPSKPTVSRTQVKESNVEPKNSEPSKPQPYQYRKKTKEELAQEVKVNKPARESIQKESKVLPSKDAPSQSRKPAYLQSSNTRDQKIAELKPSEATVVKRDIPSSYQHKTSKQQTLTKQKKIEQPIVLSQKIQKPTASQKPQLKNNTSPEIKNQPKAPSSGYVYRPPVKKANLISQEAGSSNSLKESKSPEPINAGQSTGNSQQSYTSNRQTQERPLKNQQSQKTSTNAYNSVKKPVYEVKRPIYATKSIDQSTKQERTPIQKSNTANKSEAVNSETVQKGNAIRPTQQNQSSQRIKQSGIRYPLNDQQNDSAQTPATVDKSQVYTQFSPILNLAIKRIVRGPKYQVFDILRKDYVEAPRRKQKPLHSLINLSKRLSESYVQKIQSYFFNNLKRTHINEINSSQGQSGDPTRSQARSVVGASRIKKKPDPKEKILADLTNKCKSVLTLKILCIVNRKLRQALKKIIVRPCEQSEHEQKRYLLSSSIKLVKAKESHSIQSAFRKLKFYCHQVQKRKDSDLLSVLESKRLGKTQITKFFNNLFSTASQKFIEKTANSQSKSSLSNSRTQSISENKKLSPQKLQSSNVSELQTQIAKLNEELDTVTKHIKAQKDERNQHKKDLKAKILQLETQTRTKRQKREELNKELKNMAAQSISSPQKEQNNAILRQQSEQEGEEHWRQILESLSDVYICAAVNHNQNRQVNLNEEIFSKKEYQGSNSILRAVELISSQSDLQKQSENMSLVKSVNAVKCSLIEEQNANLKAQINLYEKDLNQGQKDSLLLEMAEQARTRNLQELQAVKKLLHSYIKERYLWEWVRKMIRTE